MLKLKVWLLGFSFMTGAGASEITDVGNVIEHCFTKTGACFIQVALEDGAVYYTTKVDRRFRMYGMEPLLFSLPGKDYKNLKKIATHAVNYTIDLSKGYVYPKMFSKDLITTGSAAGTAKLIAHQILSKGKAKGTVEIIDRTHPVTQTYKLDRL